eukprot:scaffold25066_cov106-Isochrysis_galbana.AAC.3
MAAMAPKTTIHEYLQCDEGARSDSGTDGWCRPCCRCFEPATGRIGRTRADSQRVPCTVARRMGWQACRTGRQQCGDAPRFLGGVVVGARDPFDVFQ